MEPVRLLINNESAMSERFINELRALRLKPEYGQMTVATMLGVIEMFKLEVWHNINEE